MSIALECKKIRRTGFLPAFFGGGLLAALIPILNMAVRTDVYIGLPQQPLQILLDANGQMMSMLNILLIVAGACMLYHTEYADNALLKMRSLPIKESSLFFNKVLLLSGAVCTALLLETAALAYCCAHWFCQGAELCVELLKNLGFSLLLILPAVLLALCIASAFQNMWISLGIGIICVFTATMLPAKNFIVSLFPFALPFQFSEGMEADKRIHYMLAAGAEMLLLALAELIFLKTRRKFE